MSADTDVAKAMIARWNSQSLTSTVTGGIHSGRLVNPTRPYARLTVTKDKHDETTGTGYIDYRIATITLWGIGKTAIGTIVSTIKAVFDECTLSVDNAEFMRCEHLDDTIEDDETEKAGDDMQKATIPYRIWTTRTAG